jgi:hypothetical protein
MSRLILQSSKLFGVHTLLSFQLTSWQHRLSLSNIVFICLIAGSQTHILSKSNVKSRWIVFQKFYR